MRDHRRHAVVAQPAGVDRRRPEVVAQGVHLQQRRRPRRIAEVVPILALREGRARRRLDRHERVVGGCRAIGPAGTGRRCPQKFEPPPAQPMTTSGASPAISICVIASWPITVWCSRTWLSTLPSEYFVSSWVAATSTASLIAIPRLPVESGSARPGSRGRRSSRSDGDGTTSRPEGLDHRAAVRLLVVADLAP